MRGLEFLDDYDDKPIGKARKVSNREPVKKSNHKHEYKEVKVIKDSIANLHWEKIYSECVICGKNKEEIKHISP